MCRSSPTLCGNRVAPIDVVVAVNRIGAPHDGNRRGAAGGVHGRIVEAIRQGDPVGDFECLSFAGKAPPPFRMEPRRYCPDILRGDGADVSLDHLRDFLLERHFAQQLGDPCFEGAESCRPVGLRQLITGELRRRNRTT